MEVSEVGGLSGWGCGEFIGRRGAGGMAFEGRKAEARNVEHGRFWQPRFDSDPLERVGHVLRVCVSLSGDEI